MSKKAPFSPEPGRLVDDTYPFEFDLPVGDVRITAVDQYGRHSELRLELLSEEPERQLIMFFRDFDDVIDDMAYREGGSFVFGGVAGPKYVPEQIRIISAFWIDPLEATTLSYKEFLDDLMANPQWYVDGPLPVNIPTSVFEEQGDGWWLSDSKYDYPVCGISWQDAVLFANWMGKRLPTDEEWERTARGFTGRLFPWGSAFEPNRIFQLHELVVGVAIPHDSFLSSVTELPLGGTPSSDGDTVFRLADNVSEWVEDPWDYSDTETEELVFFGDTDGLMRIVRGARSLFKTMQLDPETLIARNFGPPEAMNPLTGVRCVKTPRPEWALPPE